MFGSCTWTLYIVLIVDPGIKNEEGYSAYDDGVKAGIFIKLLTINSLFYSYLFLN